ncbi:MAG TPA: cytochrome c [Rhodospirillales bacterium]|nr:cytochrome c [Rhodospirillales bacterium]
MAASMLRLSSALLAASCSLAPLAARADQPLIDYRNAVMESIGGHMSALVAIVKGEVPYTQDAPLHARAIAPLATMAGHVFPPGSKTGKTDALPAIWEQPEKFQKAMTAFQTAAADLAKAADGSPADLAAPVSALGKACKGCHDDFRKKD